MPINTLLLHSVHMNIITCLISGIGMLSLFSLSSIDIHASTTNMSEAIFPPESTPYGTSYPEWAAKWWTWILSIPKNEHPSLDTTGERCSVEQRDENVWFLAHTFGGTVERNCQVPEGKAILIPLLTGECDFLSDPTIQNEAGLAKCAWSGVQGAVYDLRINGTLITNLDEYKVTSPLFDLVIPADNAYGGGPIGPTQAVAAGIYLLLEPLPVGMHRIEFSNSIMDNPLLGTFGYAEKVAYNLGIKSE
jgi:hypothetical protein